ncbi:MAG: DUF456 family protein [Muribaculaceae bacterium]|nr:DUF456 family protein [Muribaculaceae bacterium]
MEIAGLIIGWLLLGFGVLGCFVNKIPGPLMAFLGLLIQMWMCDINVEMWALILTAVLVVVSMVVSKKLVPKIGKMVADFGKAGSWGTTIGSLVGLMIMLGGSGNTTVLIIAIVSALLILPYVFAFLFELISRKSVQAAAQAAGGALVAFLVGTMLKLAVCALAIYTVVTN